MTRSSFQKLYRKEIKEILKKNSRPKCVALMLDGTRRVLKVHPGFHNDSWLYYEDHIQGLMYKVIDLIDMLFDMGVINIIGPLITFGNLHRQNFVPEGLKRLIEPLLNEKSVKVIKKHRAAVRFYGDLEYIRNMPGGEIIDEYKLKFSKISNIHPKHLILIGVGVSTDRDTKIIAEMAIKMYQKNHKIPTYEDLVSNYFGSSVPPIDIFIRTNEMRASGGLTPLLTSHDTQWYIPVSPGVISLSEKVIREILYDYLFCRSLSHGMHEHKPITHKQAIQISDFYYKNKDSVLGIGKRIGDIWIHSQTS